MDQDLAIYKDGAYWRVEEAHPAHNPLFARCQFLEALDWALEQEPRSLELTGQACALLRRELEVL